MDNFNSGKIFSGAIVKEQLKRFWAISALAGVWYFFLASSLRSGIDAHFTARNLLSFLTMNEFTLQFGIVLIPLISVACVMSFLGSSKATTVFYSYPITKKQLLFSNAAAGIILMLLPLVVLFIGMLPAIYYPGVHEPHWWMGINFPQRIFPTGVAQGAVINTFPVVMGFIVRMTIAKMFYFAIFWIAHSLAGNRVIALLLSAFLPLFTPVITWLFVAAAQTFVFGFVTDGAVDAMVQNFIAYSNPALWSNWFSDTWRANYEIFISPYVWYGAVTAVLFVAAYAVSRRRKSELVGNSIMFGYVKNVLIFLVTTFIMLLVAGVVYNIVSGTEGIILGAAVGFVLGYVIAQMIAEKSLFMLHKLKYIVPFGAATLIIALGMWLFAEFGTGFYVNFVPEKNEISGVFINHRISGGSREGMTFIEDPEIIALTLEAHGQILNQRRASWGGRYMHSQFPITYRLHDGRFIHRAYTVTGDFVRQSVLPEIWLHESVIFHGNDAIFQPELLDSVHVSYNFPWDVERNRHNIHVRITDLEEIVLISEAVRKDAIADATETVRLRKEGTIEEMRNAWMTRTGESMTITFNTPVPTVTLDGMTHTHFSHSIWLEQTFYNTMQLLTEWGKMYD